MMRIGELAARTGVSRRSLRYYEHQDLLHPGRTGNGWRVYDEAAVHRVRTIAELLGQGLNVSAVKQLEPCLERRDSLDCDDPTLAVETYRARLVVVDRRLARLRHQRDRLAGRLRTLQGGEQQLDNDPHVPAVKASIARPASATEPRDT